jgi:hypothetical protein
MVKPTRLWPGNPALNHFTQAPNGMMVPIEAKIKYRYDKRFALLPTLCKERNWVWLNHYYKKYLVFSYEEIQDIEHYQYKLTTTDTIVEKLTDSIDFR